MNRLLFLLLFIMSPLNPCYSQADNTVEAITIGSGNTIENAKFNALRSALEQVSGSYLSANTLVINDKLISDNITSITSGSIETYEIIEQLEKGNLFYLTIKSIISPKKFSEFVSGKTGSSIAIKGGIYAANIKQLNFNEESELKAIKLLSDLYSDLLYNSIFYELEASSPIEEKFIDPNNNDGEHFITYQKLPIVVTMRFSNFIDSANVYFKNNLKLISLSESKVDNLKKINREVFPICIDNVDYFFQNKESLLNVLKYEKGMYDVDYINSFTIDDGVNKYKRLINLNSLDNHSRHSVWNNFRGYLKFKSEVINLKYIERREWDTGRIKGFNSEYHNYDYESGFEHLMWTNFNKYFYKNSKAGNCIQLWNSYTFWPIKLNGYYTLEELEKINEIKILKNISPKINYTIKTK